MVSSNVTISFTSLFSVISGTTSIIDATQTTTSSGGVVVWGHRTYTRPDETETIGGHTIIIGGVTLPPTVVTVTPNPHPTTTPTTTDLIINSKMPSWVSGTGPSVSPTATPGCLGCGQPCKFHFMGHWFDLSLRLYRQTLVRSKLPRLPPRCIPT